MESTLKDEYEMVHTEIVDVRDCITDYVKMFFAIGVALISLFAYLAVRERLGIAGGSEGGSGATISLTQDEWAIVPIALCYIILFFASILFHKFNTHNRGCGYLRALEQERHQPSTQQTTSQQAADQRPAIRLWQSVLAAPFQTKDDFQWGRVETDDHFNALGKHVSDVEDKCMHPFGLWSRFIGWGGCGLFMILRSTIFRAQTKSWTFPFQVAFGPFIMTLLLIMAWGLIAFSQPAKIYTIFQVIFLIHLFICWLGLGYRMFRLCDIRGDRTIEVWCWRSMVQRHAALKRENCRVEYLGWVLKAASSPA